MKNIDLTQFRNFSVQGLTDQGWQNIDEALWTGYDKALAIALSRPFPTRIIGHHKRGRGGFRDKLVFESPR